MNIQGKVWGYTIPLFCKNNVEVHDIFAKKGGYCSKHCHRSKYNKFIVKKGRLKITVWKFYADQTLEDVTEISAGMECTVPPGDYHMFEALEDTEALEIYWVELSESDIHRTNHGGLKHETQTNISRESEKRGSALSWGYNFDAEPSTLSFLKAKQQRDQATDQETR